MKLQQKNYLPWADTDNKSTFDADSYFCRQFYQKFQILSAAHPKTNSISTQVLQFLNPLPIMLVTTTHAAPSYNHKKQLTLQMLTFFQKKSLPSGLSQKNRICWWDDRILWREEPSKYSASILIPTSKIDEESSCESYRKRRLWILVRSRTLPLKLQLLRFLESLR